MSKIHKALQKAEKEKSGEKTPTTKDFAAPGQLPFPGSDQRLVTLNNPKSIAAEQFRKLKTSILENGVPKSDENRCILITSSVIGEGKTLTATNLAVSLAQELHHHVLLIDADLRRPAVHKSLGIKMLQGLSDYLTSDLELSEMFLKTSVPKLSILPAGTATSKAAELLSSHKMRNLIEEVRTRYSDRYIIIDSTPIMSTAEPDILAGQTGGIVFVVKAGKTPRQIIQRSLDHLKKYSILGLVFNNVDFQSAGYHYGYYKYYEYYDKEKG